MSTTAHDATGSADNGPGSRRYLIAASDEQTLATVGEQLTADPRVHSVRTPARGTLAVDADPTAVNDLRRRFGDRLTIEPDVELEMFAQSDPPDVTSMGEITDG